MFDTNRLSKVLYNKLSDELAYRKKEMMKESPEDIINGFIPYELVYKEDLLSCFIDMVLTDDEYDFLFNLENPLDWLYVQWLESDDSHMDLLETFIRNTLIQRRES